VVLQAERLALLLDLEAAHVGTVVRPFLRGHELAAIDLLLGLLLRLHLLASHRVGARKGNEACQGRYK
jgi:hypothetical protein